MEWWQWALIPVAAIVTALAWMLHDDLFGAIRDVRSDDPELRRMARSSLLGAATTIVVVTIMFAIFMLSLPR